MRSPCTWRLRAEISPILRKESGNAAHQLGQAAPPPKTGKAVPTALVSLPETGMASGPVLGAPPARRSGGRQAQSPAVALPGTPGTSRISHFLVCDRSPHRLVGQLGWHHGCPFYESSILEQPN